MKSHPTVTVNAHRTHTPFVRPIAFDPGAPIRCLRADAFQVIVEEEEELAILAIGTTGPDRGAGLFVDHTLAELQALRYAIDGAIAILSR